jgi:uncharacterized membrane protein
MNPRQLSESLRNGSSPALARRRWIIGLSMVGVAAAKLVSLYQTGLIKHLPDPPVPIFDSDKVDASNYAYKRFESPDGPIMLVSYGLTVWLAAAGGERRDRTMPWLPLLMGAKIISDIVVALVLAREEWAENKALCFYCQTATAASVASLAIAAPELLSAARQLPGGNLVERIQEATGA